ncbi:MAG TPA: hypothetical protein VGB54_02870 [Allosphingosinicella sp.]|jgi:hypothetical protein
MRNSVIPVMAVLTVVAGAIGLQIGEGAISQIDPVHFQGAATPARAVTADSRRPGGTGFMQASGWAQGYRSLAEDCGDCPALLARRSHAVPAAAQPAYADLTLQPRWDQAAEGAALAAAEEQAVRSAESIRVARYLHYPVSADQAEIAKAVAVIDAPAAAATSGEPAGL